MFPSAIISPMKISSCFSSLAVFTTSVMYNSARRFFADSSCFRAFSKRISLSPGFSGGISFSVFSYSSRYSVSSWVRGTASLSAGIPAAVVTGASLPVWPSAAALPGPLPSTWIPCIARYSYTFCIWPSVRPLPAKIPSTVSACIFFPFSTANPSASLSFA